MKSKIISIFSLAIAFGILSISTLNATIAYDYSEEIYAKSSEEIGFEAKPNNSASSINFKKFKSLKSALRTAESQDKMLMLVFSATWCAPCNYMNDYVFTNKQISSFYNSNFVNVYLDADKDKSFIKQVKDKVGNVNEIPSFLFFDKDQYFVYHFEGSQTTSDFLKKGHRALDEQGYEPKNNEVGDGGNTRNNFSFWDKVKSIFK